MQQIFCSDEVIETLVILNCGDKVTTREKHIFRESLRNLVRLAKIEEAEAMRLNLYRLTEEHDENVLH